MGILHKKFLKLKKRKKNLLYIALDITKHIPQLYLTHSVKSVTEPSHVCNAGICNIST